jgi:hypothetical protein
MAYTILDALQASADFTRKPDIMEIGPIRIVNQDYPLQIIPVGDKEL